jgi:hypothetical protein
MPEETPHFWEVFMIIGRNHSFHGLHLMESATFRLATDVLNLNSTLSGEISLRCRSFSQGFRSLLRIR